MDRYLEIITEIDPEQALFYQIEALEVFSEALVERPADLLLSASYPGSFSEIAQAVVDHLQTMNLGIEHRIEAGEKVSGYDANPELLNIYMGYIDGIDGAQRTNYLLEAIEYYSDTLIHRPTLIPFADTLPRTYEEIAARINQDIEKQREGIRGQIQDELPDYPFGPQDVVAAAQGEESPDWEQIDAGAQERINNG